LFTEHCPEGENITMCRNTVYQSGSDRTPYPRETELGIVEFLLRGRIENRDVYKILSAVAL